MVVQSVLIPRTYPLDYAINWVISHGYRVHKVDMTANFYRFRQKPPKRRLGEANYYTKILPNGIELVLMS